jgi:lactate oxidase
MSTTVNELVNGSGEQWTLREKIDTSVTLLGEKLPRPVIVTPFGSHGLHHPHDAIHTATH